MMRSLFSAVSGLKANQTAMDVIGNNVANVNTTGFKASRTGFQDIYSQTISTATAPTTTSGGINPQQVGLGVAISDIGLNMTEGNPQSTTNALDFDISGEGFFVVKASDGYYYTRNGALTLDANGYLVTANGDYVMGVTGSGATIADGTSLTSASCSKIQITSTYSGYAIDSNGTITATDSSGNIVTLGRLVLATFNNSGGLEKAGMSYYLATSNSGTANIKFANDGCGALKSGYLEMSNVDLASELTNMIITERGYQANSKVITTSDDMLDVLINLKR